MGFLLCSRVGFLDHLTLVRRAYHLASILKHRDDERR